MTDSILITGGTGKFGKHYVRHFANEGWNVLFTSTSDDRIAELLHELGEPANVHGFNVDFAVHGAPESCVRSILSEGKSVNHLVNNARSLSSLKINSQGQTERSEFMAEYLLDVVVPYELSMALCAAQSNTLRTITNIGSQYGIVAANPALYDDFPNQSPIQYGVAKAALGHLTKELAVRMADHGVRVNCIAYGGVEGRVDEAFKARYAKLTPSRRMLSESEIVGPLDFLVRQASGCITGQTLVADGGWSIW